jgi:hypothetical protein
MKCKYIIIVLIVLSVTNACAQDALKIATEVYQSIDQLKSAYDDIDKVKHVVSDIEHGKAPTVKDNKWANLADKYIAATKELESAPLPTDFDKSKYEISATGLDCSGLPDLVKKAYGYLDALKQAKQRGDDAIVKLNAASVLADSASSALIYLISVHEKLMKVPIYGEIFQWDWLELNTSVSHSLGDFRSALNAQKKKINNELGNLNLYIPNLESNLKLIESIVCIKDGIYTSDDAMHRFKLEVKGTTCIWTERTQTGGVLSKTVGISKTGNTFKISRENDNEVLSFLGYQSAIKTEILGRFPQPSFIILSVTSQGLSGSWYGLLVIKDVNAHLKELKQPGSMPPKPFSFVKQ